MQAQAQAPHADSAAYPSCRGVGQHHQAAGCGAAQRPGGGPVPYRATSSGGASCRATGASSAAVMTFRVRRRSPHRPMLPPRAAPAVSPSPVSSPRDASRPPHPLRAVQICGDLPHGLTGPDPASATAFIAASTPICLAMMTPSWKRRSIEFAPCTLPGACRHASSPSPMPSRARLRCRRPPCASARSGKRASTARSGFSNESSATAPPHGPHPVRPECAPRAARPRTPARAPRARTLRGTSRSGAGTPTPPRRSPLPSDPCAPLTSARSSGAPGGAPSRRRR